MRAEPAFEHVALLTLQIEYFECHGVYMRANRQ
ncbi:Uncharacterised protein [Bordetella pertussis]|nr:Uncharacterised protein [Bordetella pertussis]